MRDLWIPGVPRLDCSAHGLALGRGGNNRDAFHTWHTFEGIPKDYNFAAMTGARYLASTLKLAHFVYNPVWGGLVQLLPANMGARTLQVQGPNGTTVETNRYGKVHMQTEVLANAARPWTLDLTRAGIDDLTLLVNFLRSWGVADQWAWRDTVRPAATYAEANRPGYRRHPERSGHAFHSRWPANSHWDPGAITPPWSHVAGAVTNPPKPTPPPAPAWPDGWILNAQRLLNALGYTDEAGKRLDEDDDLGPRTIHATTTYQRDHGLDPDGRPGSTTLPHMEATVSTILDEIKALGSKVDAVPGRTRDTLTGTRFPGAGNARLDDVLVATWRKAGTVDPDLLKAALATVPGGQSVDAAALAEAMADELGKRLAGSAQEAV